jgi:hypothetical protein
MDEFMLEAYYRDEDRRLHDEPYYGDAESNMLDEQIAQADDDTLDEDPLETEDWQKEMFDYD